MPFNYQSLKRITGAAVIDGSLVSGDLNNLAVNGGKLQTLSITSGKFATSSVDLSGSVTTGSLAVSRGGTGISSFGGALRAVTSSGSTLSHQPHGIASIQVWTSNGTWSRPTGVKFIKVQVQGAGGGGGGHGEGGAGGGYSERFLDVTGISSVGITIGGGGGGTYYSGAAGNGNASSFGPYLSASGGHGANRQNQHSGGVSGVGSGGDLNVHTGGGYSHHARDAQAVAQGFFGSGAASNYPNGGQFGHNHEGYATLGSGGSGAHFHSYRGSNGRPGLVVVTNYY